MPILRERLAVRSSIRITGEFRGTIASDETVTIDADAAVEADVRARMVIVHGALVGCVDASREVVLHAGARLHGDVRSPSIVIERGAFFIGRTEWDSPEVDNEVLVDARAGYVRTGDFATVRIDSCEDFDLFGTVA